MDEQPVCRVCGQPAVMSYGPIDGPEYYYCEQHSLSHPELQAPPPPPDHFVRNLVIVIAIAVVAFIGWKAYDSVQDTNDFNRQQREDFQEHIGG